MALVATEMVTMVPVVNPEAVAVPLAEVPASEVLEKDRNSKGRLQNLPSL